MVSLFFRNLLKEDQRLKDEVERLTLENDVLKERLINAEKARKIKKEDSIRTIKICLTYKHHISDIYRVMAKGAGPELHLYGGNDEAIKASADENLRQITEYICKLRSRNFSKLRNITQQHAIRRTERIAYFLGGVAGGIFCALILINFL